MNEIDERRLSLPRTVLASLLGGVLLVAGSSLLWLNDHVLSPPNFTATVVDALSSQESRDAISEEIVNDALVDQPNIKMMAGAQATAVISDALGTNQANGVIRDAVQTLHNNITAETSLDVAIELTDLKNSVASTLAADYGDLVSDAAVQNIPDRYILLSADEVPKIHGYVNFSGWLAPALLALALGSLTIPYVYGRRYLSAVLIAQGILVMVGGLGVLATGVWFKSMVIDSFDNQNHQIIARGILDAFSGSFRAQATAVTVAGLMAGVLAVLMKFFRAAQKPAKEDHETDSET